MPDEKIIGIVDELRLNSYLKNIYSSWLAFVSDQNTILFFEAYSQKQIGNGSIMDEYRCIDPYKKNYLNNNIDAILKLANRKIKINKTNLDKLVLKRNKIILDIDGEKIALKTYSRQFKTIKNILVDNMSFAQALDKSGLDQAKLVYYILVILILFIGLIFFTFTR